MTNPTNCQEASCNPQRTKCEIYTRVMGYYRPVSHFNIGKKSEFYSRTYFKEAAEQPSYNQLFNTTYGATFNATYAQAVC